MTTKTNSGKTRQRYFQQYKAESLALAGKPVFRQWPDNSKELVIIQKAAACFAKSLKGRAPLCSVIQANPRLPPGSRRGQSGRERQDTQQYCKKQKCARPASGETATLNKAIITKSTEKKVYLLKVTLTGAKDIWRRIAIRGNHTLGTLHEAIFRAFDRDDFHLYSFYFSQPGSRGQARRRDAQEYTHPFVLEGDPFAGKDV